MEKAQDNKRSALIIPFLALFFVLISCKKKQEKQVSLKVKNDSKENVLKKQNLKKSLCDENFTLCKEFTDSQAKKTFLLFEKTEKIVLRDEIEEEDTEINNTRLYGKLYFEEEMKVSFFDKIDCYTNGSVNYLENTFFISDLNDNGVKEVLFLYELKCENELEPSKMKLIMIEGENKYKIRGKRKFYINTDESEMNENTNFNIDKSFVKAPKSFLDFATKKWNENLFDSQIGELTDKRKELMNKDKSLIIKIKDQFLSSH